MTIYHGSNQIVSEPKILTQGFYKDFGYGFYCTRIQKQAERWALTKAKNHIVSIYEYTPNAKLKNLKFEKMTEDWLDFIATCRKGIEHNYDIVDGPMADDQVWDYVEDFLNGNISRTAFWELAKFKYPTNQILFCTNESLTTLEFIRSYEI